MEKTQALLDLEFRAMLNLPCSCTDWAVAVTENPNYCQEDYDHFIKYSAIPKEVIDDYFKELHELLKPLEDVVCSMAPSKGIIYMVTHPEYQEEWNNNWKKSQEIMATQKEERLKIHKRMHRKYYEEYGIKFNPKIIYGF